MKTKFKVLSTQFIICLLMCLLVIPASKVLADNDNHSRQKALEVKADVPVEASMDAYTKDWYKYTVKSVEPVYFMIQPDYETSAEKRCWYIELYNSEYNHLGTEKVFIDKGSAGVQYTYHGTYAIDTVLYIKIYQEPWYSGDFDAINQYQAEYTFTAVSGVYYDYPLDEGEWEVENNNNRKSSNELKMKAPRLGILDAYVADVDYYKYTVEGDGNFKLKIVNQGSNNNAQYGIDIYDENGNSIDSRKTNIGNITSTTDTYSRKNGEVIYVAISNYKVAAGDVYQLSVIDNSADAEKLNAPLAALQGTNVVVGYGQPGATVYVQIGTKKYSAKADETRLYKVKTSTLKKGAKIQIWQKYNTVTSVKATYKVTVE